MDRALLNDDYVGGLAPVEYNEDGEDQPILPLGNGRTRFGGYHVLDFVRFKWGSDGQTKYGIAQILAMVDEDHSELYLTPEEDVPRIIVRVHYALDRPCPYHPSHDNSLRSNEIVLTVDPLRFLNSRDITDVARVHVPRKDEYLKKHPYAPSEFTSPTASTTPVLYTIAGTMGAWIEDLFEPKENVDVQAYTREIELLAARDTFFTTYKTLYYYQGTYAWGHMPPAPKDD